MQEFEKVIALFKYTRELVALKYSVVADINKQLYALPVNSIPLHEQFTKVAYRDTFESTEDASVDTEAPPLLYVKKPDFQACPKPEDILEGWLQEGWGNFRIEAEFISEKEDGSRFDDESARIDCFNEWLVLRKEWVSRQRSIDAVRRLFMQLFNIYTDLSRESEIRELMIGNGMLRVKADNKIEHPLLLKRVSIYLDAKENIITIRDTDAAPEIYTLLLSSVAGINHSIIKPSQEELSQKYLHPFDRNDAADFLKTFTHALSAESTFIGYGDDKKPVLSEIQVSGDEPIFFVRRKIDGTLKALELIIENIENTHEFPQPLRELVSGGMIEIPEITDETTIEQQLAYANGEDPDILLSKAANREQLEIAERIERYNAVLVQGPPGTGKTHTIANLIGHFLSQGKNVLVTSYTPKALSIVQEQLHKDIQHLCVTVDGDNNSSMVRSIDGIAEFMSRHTSSEMKQCAENAAIKRNRILQQQNEVRRKIYTIRFSEFNPIVFGGNDYSPKEAADFVRQNSEALAYIPGKVSLYHELPVSIEDLTFLYKSNDEISISEEKELNTKLPDPAVLPQASIFAKLVSDFDFALSITRAPEFIDELVGNASDENIEVITSTYIAPLKNAEKWAALAAADGARGGGYRARWEKLCALISEAFKFSTHNVELLMGKKVAIDANITDDILSDGLSRLASLFQRGTPSKIGLLLNKNAKILLGGVTINNVNIANNNDCETASAHVKITRLRNEISILWDELLCKNGVSTFYELGEEPESIAIRFVDDIEQFLSWNAKILPIFKKQVESTGLNYDKVFPLDRMATEQEQYSALFLAIIQKLPKLLAIVSSWASYMQIQHKKKELLASAESHKEKILAALSDPSLNVSSVCSTLKKAVETLDDETYAAEYLALCKLYSKYNILDRRRTILAKLRIIAPIWAEAIEQRQDIHGLPNCPDDIADAWKWKQFAGIIDEITSQPFEALQHENARLSGFLQQSTAELAACKAWYHLLRNTESNLSMRQALQGWKMTVRKIGKGTGKNAPLYRRQAMEQMSLCQTAVPAWIMPISKAMDTLNPAVNKFDVVIVDEASQCDLSSIGILYMGKKIIIVGDDKQVSPLAIGMDLDRINALRDMYVKEIIPNWHLYEAKTSLYDIAQTTFHPLMLREHFRCLPEIIGYSNKLSYDYKIKPLRDSGTAKLFPQVVNYRVANGERSGRRKLNRKEAETIVAIIMACIEQPEYSPKMTFGVVSLLGDEQAKLIQEKILERISADVIEERRILCGNASHFQGDERDVILLSLVDSNEGDGPLRMTGEGVDASTKQRYNVAASRAKEQLWVIHSLDYAKDLKSGDMRRDLLEYAANPNSFSRIAGAIEKKAESPFEDAVGKALVAKGYSIAQQYAVGAYRIDMVVSCDDKKIAIECDGEAYHSTEMQIRSDMERQAILERVGWQFIRIRGSEYFRNPEKTMERILFELNELGIFPESRFEVNSEAKTSELLERIKLRVQQILDEWNDAEEMDVSAQDIDLSEKGVDAKVG